MKVKARTKYDPPVFKQGYRITFVRDETDSIIGALVEGPRIPRPLYIPREPGSRFSARLPEHIKRFLERNGFRF